MPLSECHFIDLPTISDPDGYGHLTVAEVGKSVPFPIRRIYYLHGVPSGAARGAHAHKMLNQVFIAISGTFDLLLEDGVRSTSITLSRPTCGYFVGRMIWRDLRNFTPGAVCLVLASDLYHEEDYIRNHESFLKLVRASGS
jgi:hypothetical protein